jgi:phosphotransacetylase
MNLPRFDELHAAADARRGPVALAAAGGDDPSVLRALEAAHARGWVAPILVGPAAAIRAAAEACGVDLAPFTILEAEGEDIAPASVAEVRRGRARLLMKGRIATPHLMHAVLDPAAGLRGESGRVVCQVVLMEVDPPGRRFLMADTGICVAPRLARRIDILDRTVEAAHALGVPRPRVALMAATETVNLAMPETVEAAELQHRNRRGEFPGCVIRGPLSFDLAFDPSAAAAKQLGGGGEDQDDVLGAADLMIFPSLLAANLTVKAIMYTAPCRFGGVLQGTLSPVVFMSRADTPDTRLNSLALALRLLGS